ncbi:MAG: hypothetical protein KJ587_12390 [Alphaproteobacteria bacterium]|nr:hypothetical protein [Alphaproteobacteria bacterium]
MSNEPRLPAIATDKNPPILLRTPNLDENCKDCMNKLHEIAGRTPQTQDSRLQAGLQAGRDPLDAQPDICTAPLAKLSPHCTAM